MKDISVIIPSFNTKETTLETIQSITQALDADKVMYEIIVVDNDSEDGSQEALQKYAKKSKPDTFYLICNDTNVGFGAANNIGVKKAKGKYLLLYNSDMIASNIHFNDIIEYMNLHKDIGGLTVRVEMKNGEIDPASHRGFPTLWRSLAYFTKLQALTKHIPGLNKLFGGYHMVYEDLSVTHDIDSPNAAFMMIPRYVYNDIGGFDEDYFMYGEDLDLSFRIKERGFRIVYYPKHTVIHLKYASGLKNKYKKVQNKTKYHFHNAMKIFYDKHYAKKHGFIINSFVHKAIDFKYWLSSR